MSEPLTLDARIARLRETSHPGWRGEALALIEELQEELDACLKRGCAATIREQAHTGRLEAALARSTEIWQDMQDIQIAKLEAALAVAEKALRYFADYSEPGSTLHYTMKMALEQIAKLKGGA